MDLATSNPVRAGIEIYLNGAGTERGYGFFAPAVSNSAKIVFEVHYEDGHIEYDLPHIKSAAAGLRFIALLDNVNQTEYEPLRQVMLKMLTYSAWTDHPGATSIRTVCGYIDEPTRAEARRGKKEVYRVSFVYDFSFPRQP